MESSFTESPVLLLSYHEGTREFKLSEEGRAILRQLESPLAVIGVAGMYRTGKSYLLNRVLLDRKLGFGVGPTVNPCTKGIWIWGSPIKGQTIDGTPCSVIILDTEGIGALDQDSDHDSRIFSLTVLIVSCFIYNSRGSIDEEALNSLSLVVNLTKNIQVKSKSTEEAGVEEYAQYFPSFIWVVRDFALRLVDTDGEALSSKEYLEKALNAQKGFSDLAEEKNRIRRLLKEFFKDRDCFTLVRPVNNEKDLHNLEHLELKDLRQEFVDQYMSLRHKVLNYVKPKALNGRLLNGVMLVELIESYVNAVNKGAVPNIENAWNYICKNECGKAFEEAQEIYTKTLSGLLTENYPNSEEEILSCHKESRKKSFSYFRQRALGEEAQIFTLKLKEALNEKWQQLKFQNDLDSEKQCLEFLRNNYNSINSKVKSNEYKSFLEFEREIRTLQQYYKEHGPKGPQRDKLLFQFCQGKIIECADIFTKHLNSEIEIMEETHAEQIRVLEMDSNMVKEEIVKEKVELKKIIMEVEVENKVLHEKDEKLEEELKRVREEKERGEVESRNLVKRIKDDFQKEIQTLKDEIALGEESRNSINGKLINLTSEYKEKSALADQKLLHLEKQLEESKKHEKDLDQEIKSQTKSHSTALKDLQSRLESQLKASEQKFTDEREAKLTLKKDLEEAEEKLSNIQSTMSLEVAKLQSRIEEISSQNKVLTQTIDKKDKEFQLKSKENEKIIEENISKHRKQIEEIDKKAKKTEESLRADLSKSDKENAVLSQKNEFLETQVKELKDQLDEERKQHTMMMTSLNFITDSSKNLELELEALKEKHANEIKFIESQNDSTKNQLLVDIEKLTQAKIDIELRYKLDSSEWLQKHENLSEDIQILTNEKEKLKDVIIELKKQLENTQEDFESRYKLRVSKLEKQIDEITEKLSNEIQQEKKKAEESFGQLKDSYESDKKRLETRLVEEKEKYEKRLKNLTEDYEEKIKQDQENFEDELECKDQELRELEQYSSEQINLLKNQNSLDQQKIETLERYLKDLKSQYESQERNYNHLIDQNQVRFNQERNLMQEKLDKLNLDLSAKERDLAMLNFQKQQIDSQYSQKSEELKDLKSELENLKTSFNLKSEDLKESNRKMTEEIISLKSDYKRELALISQENDFKSARVQELERLSRETEEKYHDTLRLLKNGGQDSGTIEKLSSDKELLTRKLQEKKKTMKQLQQSFTKQSAELDKEKFQLNEKIANLERIISDLEFKNALDKEKDPDDSRTDLDSTVYYEEIDSLKSQLQDLQHELASNKALLDRERLLWENKFKFLSEQKDSAKSDLAEAQRKFEFTLQQLQKREQTGKEKQEGTLNSLMSSIETRYNSKVKDLQDFSNSTIEHLNLKIKLLEQESKGLKEELEIARRGKSSIIGSIDKKCKKLQEVENKLIAEIEALRIEKERKSKEILEMGNLDRDNARNRNLEMEKKIKDAESLKNSMYLELEKERSKWQMERDHLLAAKNEALDKYETLQSKQEMLLRENERMRSERTKNRSLASKRTDHSKGASSQAVGSPSKLLELYSHRLETDSIRNDSQGSYRKHSFGE